MCEVTLQLFFMLYAVPSFLFPFPSPFPFLLFFCNFLLSSLSAFLSLFHSQVPSFPYFLLSVLLELYEWWLMGKGKMRENKKENK